MASEDLKETIRQNAEGLESAESDGLRAKRHSLPDQIAADKYLISKRAAISPITALACVKLIPPSAAG